MNKKYSYTSSKRVFFLIAIRNICVLQDIKGQLVEKSKASINDSGLVNNNPSSKNKLTMLNKDWQLGGIFEGKTPYKEIRNLRIENSKKFNRADGKIDVIIGGPFHYKDADGIFLKINLKVKESNDSLLPFENNENVFIDLKNIKAEDYFD